MDFDIIGAAGDIAAGVEKDDFLTEIGKIFDEHPNGAFLFVMSETNLEDSNAVYISTNVGMSEGLAIADVYRFITLNNAWNAPEEVDEEPTEE